MNKITPDNPPTDLKMEDAAPKEDAASIEDAAPKKDTATMEDATSKETRSRRKRFFKVLRRIFIWIFSTLLVLLLGAYVFLFYTNKGPSPHLSSLFVSSAMESSAGGYLVRLFYSKEEIEQIRNQNLMKEINEVTDTTLIHIMAAESLSQNNSDNSANASSVSDNSSNPEDPDGDGIIVYDVHGATYRGKMMVVLDPSRVKVGVINTFDLDLPGMTLENIVAKYDAVAGVNGGQYDDEIGLGSGGMPIGIVISNGQLLLGDSDTVYGVYGFTRDNVLVVGDMTASQAVAMGIRDAVSFGPALIVNGRAANYSGLGSGLNPRTAIGQRSDGAVLLLVIEGRQADSLGASMADIIEIMLEYGAVNAANLDGGMSSAMVYNGEKIIDSCTLGYTRKIPTAFIVERM